MKRPWLLDDARHIPDATAARRRVARTVLAAVGWGWLVVQAQAQSGLMLAGSFDNRWYIPFYDVTAWTTNAWTNYVGQSLHMLGGHAGAYPVPTSGVAGVAGSIPSDGAFQLVASSMGAPVPEQQPDYYFGDIIAWPFGADTNQGPLNISPSNSAFYTAAADAVYAADYGYVTITWALTNGAQETLTYLISAVPVRTPKRLFWTAHPWQAPPVTLISQDAVPEPTYPVIHYNSSIFKPVGHGILDWIPYFQNNFDFTGVWWDTISDDKTNHVKQLHSAGCSGLFLLEYFMDPGMTRQCGVEIVQVMPPQINIQTVDLGDRLLPMETYYAADAMYPNVRRGHDRVYAHASGSQAGWVFPIDTTTDDPSKIEIYWQQPGLLDILWPYESDWYAADWGENPQLYLRGGSEKNAAVLMPVENHAEIMKADPFWHARLHGGEFYTDGPGYTLLKYSLPDGGVAFETIQAVDHTNPQFVNRMTHPWTIGTEIAMVDSEQDIVLALNGQQDGMTFTDRSAPCYAYTWELWLNPATLNDAVLVRDGTGQSAASPLRLLGIQNGRIVHVNNDGNYHVQYSSTLLQTGQWYHVAISAAGSGLMQLYVNGQPEGGTINVGTLAANDAYGLGINANFWAWAPETGSVAFNLGSFAGQVDEVRIWTVARSQGQIAETMRVSLAGTETGLRNYYNFQNDSWYARDGSPHHVNGQFQGAPAHELIAPRAFEAALGFQGASGMMLIPDAVGAAQPLNLTVELWVQPQVVRPSTIWQRNQSSSSPGPGMPMLCLSGIGTFEAYVADTNGVGQWINGATVAQAGQWYHVALSISNNGLAQLYVNGLADGAPVSIGTLWNQGNQFELAGPASGYMYFAGYVNDVRLWNVARSPAQIRAAMFQKLAGSEPGLTAFFNFEDDSNPAAAINLTPNSASQNGILVGDAYYLAVPPFHAGQTAPDFPGFIYADTGNRYNPDFYDYPSTADTNINSHIFPVNSGLLEVWWAAASAFNPVLAAPVYWPAVAQIYSNQWPVAAPDQQIVIASGQGTGELPDDWAAPAIYYQNDFLKPGYNPNEEHALMIGATVFALRDDLNQADSSQPFVLLEYFDTNALPQMALWSVVATNAAYGFAPFSQLTVPILLQPPMPLAEMPLCAESYVSAGSAYKDRNLDFWGYQAGNDGVSPMNVTLRFWYQIQPGFAFPDHLFAPQAGDHIPWRTSAGGVMYSLFDPPQAVVYQLNWPTNAPVLALGETLGNAAHGLPAIRGQASVRVLYQQSTTADPQRPSVKLLDPTVARGAPLSGIPGDLNTADQVSMGADGNFYFLNLPPHLQGLLYYNPSAAPTERLQLMGRYVDQSATGGENYYQLNFLEGSILQTNTDLGWVYAMSQDPAWRLAVPQLPTAAVEISDDATPFDSLALSAGWARGTGWVTVAFNTSTNLCDPGDPISLNTFMVMGPYYQGEVEVLNSQNPIDERISMRHSGDFAGRDQTDFTFDWRYNTPVDGQPPPTPPDAWPVYAGAGLYLTVSGQGVFTLQDHVFAVRYRANDPAGPMGTNWSPWTSAALAEGWVKRVMARVTPFEQRLTDLLNNAVNPVVSMVSQAGRRWEGNVPMNSAQLNSLGLIEFYQTVFNQASMMSINAGICDPDANNALRLAAGRIYELYTVLGNEAYADAVDPTIAFGTDDQVYGDQATSLFCFMNQTPSLLDEELALLRGRDNTVQPTVFNAPYYNRLLWNYSGQITGGELAYALNYNIRSQAGNVSGTISADDAAALYPQGHGDAWGHYLTALAPFYGLLHQPSFAWQPVAEMTQVGEADVTVNYYHERQFAAGAAAKARAGSDIAQKTWSHDYAADSRQFLLEKYCDANAARAWGLGQWGARVGQGAYFDWLAVNALIPARDTDTNHVGVQVVDREHVPELAELALAYRGLQTMLDAADAGLNPLGLSANALPFDIDPAQVTQSGGATHFEQIYARAVQALNNAVLVFNDAKNCTQLLRRQEDSAVEFQNALDGEEESYTAQLIEIFGYPYADDIGPGRTYPQGYEGPDLIHFNYVDLYALTGAKPTGVVVSITITNYTPAFGEFTDALAPTVLNVEFYMSGDGFQVKPATWTGSRRAVGRLQQGYGDFIRQYYELQRALAVNDAHLADLQLAFDNYVAQHQVANAISQQTAENRLLERVARKLEFERRMSDRRKSAKSEFVNDIKKAASEALPVCVGMADDVTSVGRSALEMAGAVGAYEIRKDLIHIDELAYSWENDFQEARDSLADYRTLSEEQKELRAAQAPVLSMWREQEFLMYDVQIKLESLAQAEQRYLATLAEGQRLLQSRTTFRQRSAARIQRDRYQDMAYRLFRNEALAQYAAAFAQAARYTYLAARAYGYETGLDAPNALSYSAADFLADIMQCAALGRVEQGVPVAGSLGDAGLAGVLARMNANWDVLKGRLGINNPEQHLNVFSLRNEWFRIGSPTGTTESAASQALWQNALWNCVVDDLPAVPEFQRYCLSFFSTNGAEPGIVIPFATTIDFGRNFFGWPLAGGDNAYDATRFATKIQSVGLQFIGYNPSLADAPTAYLVPLGVDALRSPAAADGVPEPWMVVDQALPVPYALSSGDMNEPDWLPLVDSLSGGLMQIRKHPSFRAYHDLAAFTPDEICSNQRLIGRSAWNTQWVLIIPAGSLGANRNQALQTLIGSITDIYLYINAYSYAGN